MSGSGTIYTEQSVLGHTLGFAPMAFPAHVFVGLCSAAMPPSETVGGIEAFGGGYTRMPSQFALIDTPANIAANVASVEWPIATAGWGTLGFFELWDAAAGGNRLYWGALIDTASQLPTTITVSAGDIVRFSAGTLAVQAATGSGGTSSVGAYLPLAGGTLSGPLLLAADPTTYLQAATKQYVDAHSGTGGGPGFLPLSGGTMLGNLNMGTAALNGTAVMVTGTHTIRYDTTGNNAILFTPGSTNAITGGSLAQMDSQLLLATSGGTPGNVYANAQFGSSIQGAPNNYIWSVNSILDYHGTGGNGQHAALAGTAIRRTQNAGGAPNNPELWSGLLQAIDYTNTDSALSAGLNALEIDLSCGNTDSANNRRGIGMYLGWANPGSDVPPVFHLGLHIAATQGSYDYIAKFEAPFNIAALDLRNATAHSGAHTVWFMDGGDIAWNTAGTARTYYDTAGLHFNSTLQIDGILGVNAGATIHDGLLVADGGIGFNPALGSGATDLTKHISLYGGVYGMSVTGGYLNHVADVGATHAFYAGSTRVGAFSAAFGMQVGDITGPTWTFGSAAPVSSQPIGSLYSRAGGAVGATLYVSRGGGTWAALAGV